MVLLALTLLMAQVVADHHDATVATNDLALVADLLDAGVDLHVMPLRVVRLEVVRARRTAGLLVAVDDAPAGQVVRRELDDDAVLGEDADVVLPHLSGDVCQNEVPVLQLNAEHRVGQGLHDLALDLDSAVFFRHNL